RLAGAPRVATDHHVPERHPPLRVHRLPVHVGATVRHTLPRQRIPLTEVDVLRIGPERDDHRKRPRLRWPKHVGHHGLAITERNRHVLLDRKRVAHALTSAPLFTYPARRWVCGQARSAVAFPVSPGS